MKQLIDLVSSRHDSLGCDYADETGRVGVGLNSGGGSGHGNLIGCFGGSKLER